MEPSMATPRPQVVLITGATSGIGGATAKCLTQRGHTVFGTGRRVPEGPGADGVNFVQMDVDDTASVERAVAAVLDQAGRIDAVINNAGFGIGGSVEDTSVEEAMELFQTNVFGVLRVCRAVLPGMRRRQDGTIVTVSSLGGRMGLPFQGLYAASKFAIEGMMESLRMEVRGLGVRVTLVEPGDVATGFTAARRLAAASAEGSAYRAPFLRALGQIESDEKGGVTALAAARVVARVVEDRDPPLRITVGKPDQRLAAVLQGLLPGGLFQRILADHYHLDRD
jgi:NADP-dependent 3-hydroxy acid dehydrogenase YdfG